MCSADKVTLVDAMYRANLYTFTASGAERVINGGKVILYGDSTVRTGFLTLHTADTSVGAVFTCLGSLVVVGALNYYT